MNGLAKTTLFLLILGLVCPAGVGQAASLGDEEDPPQVRPLVSDEESLEARQRAERWRLSQPMIALPEKEPDLEVYLEQEHIIFWDATEFSGEKSPSLQSNWETQAGLLAAEIRELGVPPEQVTIVGLRSARTFARVLTAIEGDKRVYFLGHSSPLAIHVGGATAFLPSGGFDLLESTCVTGFSAYGCRFADTSALGETVELPENMELYGHWFMSRKHWDDSPHHPFNPMVAVELNSPKVSDRVEALFDSDFHEWQRWIMSTRKAH